MTFNLVPEVITEIYKDLLGPSFKNIGKALGTGSDTLNALLLPLSFYNEKRRIIYTENIKKLHQRLEEIPEDKIIEIPSEIANPILDKFSCVSNEHLAQLFHNLLINAASLDTANIAHPGFISVIERLSPDEAKILVYMKDMRGLPALNLSVTSSNHAEVILLALETSIDKQVQLTLPEHKNLYFENLTSLGILKVVYNQMRSEIWQNMYTEIEMNFTERIKETDDALKGYEAKDLHRNKSHAFYDITDFGRMFIKACIEPTAKAL